MKLENIAFFVLFVIGLIPLLALLPDLNRGYLSPLNYVWNYGLLLLFMISFLLYAFYFVQTKLQLKNLEPSQAKIFGVLPIVIIVLLYALILSLFASSFPS